MRVNKPEKNNICDLHNVDCELESNTLLIYWLLLISYTFLILSSS
jgi:hypothetical protein